MTEPLTLKQLHTLQAVADRTASDGAAWTASIAEQLGIPTHMAYHRLYRLAAKGYLTPNPSTAPQQGTPRTYWNLTTKGTKAVEAV